MRFGVLGAVEAERDGSAIPLGGPKQRALLALLLLDANTPVGRDRLVDGLWGEAPPPSAGASLDSYLSRLRRLLGPDRVERQPAGYTLRVERGELDLDRFEALLADARGETDAAQRSDLLRTALDLWRGPPLADVQFEPFAAGECRRLEERRVATIELRVDADLESGADLELVPELEQLVREHPLREGFTAQLMLALYRCGRQADALARFRALRRRLHDELGLEPGHELQLLERRILAHDAELVLEPSLDVRPVRSRRRRGTAATAAVAGLTVLGAVVAFLAATANGRRPSGTSATNQLVLLDARSGRTSQAIGLAGNPAALASAAGSLWAANVSQSEVSRIDPRRGVVDRIPVVGEPGSLAVGAGAVWVASTLGSTVERIDPVSDAVVQTIQLGKANPVSLAFGAGGLWVADQTDQALIELDPQTGSPNRTLSVDLRPTAVAVAAGKLWVVGSDTGAVEELDPRSGQAIATFHVGDGPDAIVATNGAVWVANSLDGTVSRIDPTTASIAATIPVGDSPDALAAAGGAVWVANQYSATISKIDPATNHVVATRRVSGRPTTLAAVGQRVWIGTVAADDAHRGGTLRLISTGRFATVDPATYNSENAANGFLFMRLAYDTLVSFEPSSGPDGLRLVPDLALQLPVATGGGTSYAFQLRPGIRYSDGRLVKASDFRRAIERLFRLHGPGTTYYTGLVGAGTCERQQGRCDLSRGIVTNDAAGTIVFHLDAPDPDFLYKLTPYAISAPVPPGTPYHDVGFHPVPGTGPYRIVSASLAGVRFARNPRFREWSHAAQPNGFPDAIVWRYSNSRSETVAAIERGQADWTLDLVPPAQLRMLQTRLSSQLHTSPAPIVEFVPLNARRPPFDDPRVRQALNYAIDRRKIADWYGGPSVATPACQPLAPGLPGYRRYCPYTLRPRTNGAWSAPNLAKARRLVAASGTRGQRIDVWAETDEVAIPTQEPPYIAKVLRSLGYRTHLHLTSGAAMTIALRGTHQLSVDGDWLPDYPDPSSYLPAFFACNGGNSNGYYCDPKLDRAMQRATLLEADDPAHAAELWERIDHQLTDQAVWVTTVDLNGVELVSKRLGNYEYNPVWGFIPDQAWVR